jgi:Spy/CpxP family protein refolding chaperone
MKLTRSIVVISLLAFSGAAFAQSPAPAPAAPGAMAPATPAMPATPKTQKPRTAKSLECSKQADGQGLHGKPRHAFMSTCKKS